VDGRLVAGAAARTRRERAASRSKPVRWPDRAARPRAGRFGWAGSG